MFKNKLFLYGLGTGLIIASLVLQLMSFTNKTDKPDPDKEEIQWNAIFLEQLDNISKAAQQHGYRLIEEQGDHTTDDQRQNSPDGITLIEEKLIEELSIEEQPVEESAQLIVLTIIEGMGSIEVATLLEELNLIADREEFEQAMGIRELTRRIQKGTYSFEAMPQLDDLIHTITK